MSPVSISSLEYSRPISETLPLFPRTEAIIPFCKEKEVQNQIKNDSTIDGIEKIIPNYVGVSKWANVQYNNSLTIY